LAGDSRRERLDGRKVGPVRSIRVLRGQRRKGIDRSRELCSTGGKETYDGFAPQDPELQEFWLRLTEESRRRRFEEALLSRTEQQLTEHRYEQEVLDSRRTIFKHDVELDSLFCLLKVGMVLLVTFVLKEYLGNARMSVGTFLDRVATLPARLRHKPELEILTFEYNHRDPEVMGLLQSYADAINAKGLTLRSGKKLRIVVESAPKPRRPPPPGSWVGTGDRFRR